MTTRPRLSDLQKRISEKGKSGSPKSGKAEKIEANPEHGSKGDFVKVTVTLPPQVYEIVLAEQARRKIEGPKLRRTGEKAEPHGISAIIREALVEHLSEKG